MLKVVICAYDALGAVGGPLTWLLRLVPALQQQGLQVRILFLTWGEEGGPTLRSLRELGVSCTAVSCPPTTEERTRWILEQLRLDPPDVFVPNLVTPAWFAARWVMAAGIPCVGVLHSDDAFYRGLQDVFVFGQAAFRISELVCVSRELESAVAKRRPSATQLRRIPYGVPVPARRVERSTQGLRLAFVGRLAEEQKRISDVTRALCRATREVPGVTAVLYGDGPERRQVEDILGTEGCGLPVSLGGRIPSERIQEKLLHCEVLVLLSDYEGLPIAVLEAMACGCVPVCLRIRSGIPELVEDGATGLLVDDRGDGFIAALRRLQDEPGLWERLSAAARSRIEEGFSDTFCHERWAALLTAAAACGGRKRPLRVPARIHLPPVHPALAPEDPRLGVSSLPVAIYRRMRAIAHTARVALSSQD